MQKLHGGEDVMKCYIILQESYMNLPPPQYFFLYITNVLNIILKPITLRFHISSIYLLIPCSAACQTKMENVL